MSRVEGGPAMLGRVYEFSLDGVILVGRLFQPEHSPPHALAILTGPLTSVKEQASGTYAAALAERGFVALAFDHRTFGQSGGAPRQFENPYAKVEDIKAALTALRAEPRVGALPAIGVGVCAGGGYMARAVADDPRFAGFASVAGYFNEVTPQSLSNAAPVIERARAAEAKWKSTGEVELIPAVAPDGGDVAMPLREAYEYYGTPRGAVANYTNAFAVQSRAYLATFDSLGAAGAMRVPALIVHSEHALAPALARKFVAGLQGPHEEVWLDSRGQIDFYDQRSLIAAAADAIADFTTRCITHD